MISAVFGFAQVQLKQAIPRTQAEQMEYSLAAERRRMRLIHAETIIDLLSSCSSQTGKQRLSPGVFVYLQDFEERPREMSHESEVVFMIKGVIWFVWCLFMSIPPTLI